MKKLRLSLDDLQVQSFLTGTEGEASGTVHGRGATDPGECPTGDANRATCVEWGCEWYSGGYTCGETCPETCEYAVCRTDPWGGWGSEHCYGDTFLATYC